MKESVIPLFLLLVGSAAIVMRTFLGGAGERDATGEKLDQGIRENPVQRADNEADPPAA